MTTAAPTRIIVCGALEGAYDGCVRGKGPRRDQVCLTHAVELDAAGSPTRVLCRRVKLDSMCDDGPKSDWPTCEECSKRLRRLPSYTINEEGTP